MTSKPKNILEIGTYTGYSALCLAEGLKEKGTLQEYGSFRLKLTLMFAGSFLLSSFLNFFLAMFLLDGAKDKESYNLAVGKVMGYGYLVIGIPLMAIMIGCFIYLMKRIASLTGLTKEEYMIPR